MNRKPVAYVSGPISNIPERYEAEFAKVEDYLVKKGFEVKNPVKFTEDIKIEYQDIARIVGKDLDYKDPTYWRACMDRCFKELEKADCLVLTESFGKVYSSGTEAELCFADNLYMSVFEFSKADFDKKINKWLSDKDRSFNK